MKDLGDMDRVLDRHDVCQLLGIGENTFGLQCADRGFPKPFKWSKKTEPRWLYSEVVDFIRRKKAEA